MSENIEAKKLKKKKKISKSGIVLIVGIAVIAIPCLIFAFILGKAFFQNGTPRLGSRFTNDLTPEITKDDVNDLELSLKTLTNVEDAEVKVAQGQLKIFVDVKDSISGTDFDKVVSDAYNNVSNKLPIDKYFTKTDSAKMYDLQINVYTSLQDDESRQYKLLHKNSSEETFAIDDMANPKDPDLALELEGKKVESDGDVPIETDDTEKEKEE